MMIKIELNIAEALEVAQAMDFTECETGSNATFREAWDKIKRALVEALEEEKRDR